MQHVVPRNQIVAQTTPLPPPVLGPQPPHPRAVLVNQIGYEEPIEYTDYEVEIDLVTKYVVDSSKMYPQYYIEDPLGQVKHVYQLGATAGRGCDINATTKRPPLQCFHCQGPHRVSECLVKY